MSFEFPLLFDANTDARELGESFRRIVNIERSRGLIDPYQGGYGQPNPEPGNPNSTSVRQIDDISELVPGSSTEDYATLTTLQAAQNLKREINADPLTTTDLLERNLDTGLDPRLEQAVYAESMRTISNIGSEKAQDFVNEMREGVQSFYEEKNLYNVPPEGKEDPVVEFLRNAAVDFNKDGSVSQDEVVDSTLRTLFKLGEAQAKKTEAEQKKLREETILKPAPTATPAPTPLVVRNIADEPIPGPTPTLKPKPSKSPTHDEL